MELVLVDGRCIVNRDEIFVFWILYAQKFLNRMKQKNAKFLVVLLINGKLHLGQRYFFFQIKSNFKCMDNCKPSEQNRKVYCMSNSNKRAASRMCNNLTMPVVKRNCSINHCPYQWVAGPWSTV